MLHLPLALVAQWIERRPPEPGAQVRVLPGALILTVCELSRVGRAFRRRDDPTAGRRSRGVIREFLTSW